MGRKKQFSNRVGINLTDEDTSLMIELQAKLQKEKQGRVTVTEIMRKALHDLAIKEGVKQQAETDA